MARKVSTSPTAETMFAAKRAKSGVCRCLRLRLASSSTSHMGVSPHSTHHSTGYRDAKRATTATTRWMPYRSAVWTSVAEAMLKVNVDIDIHHCQMQIVNHLILICVCASSGLRCGIGGNSTNANAPGEGSPGATYASVSAVPLAV